MDHSPTRRARGEALLREFTPELELHTLFVLDEQGRIVSTREASPQPGPRLALIRGATSCAWAAGAEIAAQLAARIGDLAREELPTRDFRSEPVHAKQYAHLLGGRVTAGPAFTFPALAPESADIVTVTDVSQLERYFRGWTAAEIPECSPILAVTQGQDAISVCFCARRSAAAAEAGVETAMAFRDRGLGVRVTAAWARSVRATGRLPLYSTSWSNAASLALARKLSLTACASIWSLSD